jgi:hypothetical protein
VSEWRRVVIGERPEGEELMYAPGEYASLYPQAMAECQVGDTVTEYLSWPLTGRVILRITRMDETGVYGEQIFNNVRVLKLEDVR